MSLINKITTDLINKLIIEFHNENNKKKIKDNIIHPIIFYIRNYIMRQLYPFIIIGSLIFILTFIFSLIMLILIITLIFKK